MGEGKSTAVNMTKERMIILVKLRSPLCCHTGMPHNRIHAVRNMNLHLPSGNRTLVNSQAVVEVIRNAGCVRATHLTLSCKSIQNFIFRMGVEHTFEVD